MTVIVPPGGDGSAAWVRVRGKLPRKMKKLAKAHLPPRKIGKRIRDRGHARNYLEALRYDD